MVLFVMDFLMKEYVMDDSGSSPLPAVNALHLANTPSSLY